MDDIFTIYKFGVEDSRRVLQSANEPHLHDYEELLIGINGQLEHFIDYRSEIVDAPFVSFITEGKVHRLRPLEKDGKCDIWVIRFNSDFIADTIFRLYTEFHDKSNMCMPFNVCFKRFDTLCNIIYQEYNQPTPDYSVIRQLLIALISIIESERKKKEGNEKEDVSVQSATFKNFLQILEEHFREPQGVNFYADKLFMTARNLNLICQHVLHQSVSEIIETRKLVEAKNLLVSTRKTIAEIGYELGFNEKTYFTHVFKKREGISPSDFRKEMSALISE
jgi:AraC family transcriptional activator of pobA